MASTSAEVEASPVRVDAWSTRLPKTNRLYWWNLRDFWATFGGRANLRTDPTKRLSISLKAPTQRSYRERRFAAILTNSRQYPDISSLA